MALDPLEWVIIGVIVIVIFLWGPQKIPEIARSLGRAKKEFDQATKELSSTAAAPQGQVQPQSKSGDEILIETARRLGIQTEGKTREQISEEIVRKSSQPG
jgi:sec-independent protein translocase protein TatA